MKDKIKGHSPIQLVVSGAADSSKGADHHPFRSFRALRGRGSAAHRRHMGDERRSWSSFDLDGSLPMWKQSLGSDK